MAEAASVDFETGHSDVVNALQLDYYGRRVATASSDHSIRIFDVASERPSLLATLQGHTGPVWHVAWAHPKFGSLLASCSFDNSIIVWKETDSGWMQMYQSPPTVHSASVNGLSWASHEVGLMCASASSDGSVGVFEYQSDGTWKETKVPGVDAVSCTSISWAPSGLSASLSEEGIDSNAAMRFVVGGCENFLKILSTSGGGWRTEQKLMAHGDWVLDVAWAPSMTASRNYIASSGQDGKVIVWRELSRGQWEHQIVHQFPVPVHGVSWSVTGSVLSVMDANHSVTLWKENHVTGQWAMMEE